MVEGIGGGGVQFSVFYAAHGVVSVVSPHKLNDAVSGRVREFVLSAILHYMR